jgi:hypothetical protein
MPAIPPAQRAFEVAARLGGFARATATLNVSTSAVSHLIRRIEKSLGARLLKRGTGEGVGPNPMHAAVLASLVPVASTQHTPGMAAGDRGVGLGPTTSIRRTGGAGRSVHRTREDPDKSLKKLYGKMSGSSSRERPLSGSTRRLDPARE